MCRRQASTSRRFADKQDRQFHERQSGRQRQRKWEVKELWSMIGSTFLYSFQYIISCKLRLLISSGTLEEAPERWLTRMQTLKLRFCYSPL
jgi:hypothetical protein